MNPMAGSSMEKRDRSNSGVFPSTMVMKPLAAAQRMMCRCANYAIRQRLEGREESLGKDCT